MKLSGGQKYILISYAFSFIIWIIICATGGIVLCIWLGIALPLSMMWAAFKWNKL